MEVELATFVGYMLGSMILGLSIGFFTGILWQKSAKKE